MLRFTLVIILLFLINVSVCQTRLFTQEDGLSSKDVTAVIQSRNGYLWVGTSNGLNRYNGYEFSLIDKAGLNSAKIKCLYEDAKGLLWIGTWQGLCVLDQKTLSAKWFFQNSRNNKGKISNCIINCISAYTNGSVLAGTSNGELFLFRNGDSCNLVYSTPLNDYGLMKRQITTVSSGLSGEVWIVSDYIYTDKLNKHFKKDPGFKSEVKNVNTVIPLKGSGSVLLIDLRGHIFQVSEKTGKQLFNPLINEANTKNKNGAASFITGKKELWVSYESGTVAKIDFINHSIQDFSNDIKPYGNAAMSSICIDKNGLIWIGTNYGLIKMYSQKKMFENYLKALPDVKEKNSMRAMIETSDGDIYAGGYSGLFKIKKGEKTAAEVPVKMNKKVLPHDFYYPFRLVDDSNLIWIASEVRGICRFNKKTQELELPFKSFPGYEKKFHHSFALLEQGHDSLWIGTNSGLFLYRRKNKVLVKQNSSNDPDISEIQIIDLAKNSENKLWVGMRSTGLIEFNLDNKAARVISDPLNRLTYITCLFFADDTTLLIGTRGAGLAQMNTKTHKTGFYTKKDGLADNAIASVATDNCGNYWIATFNGLSKLNKTSGHFENYYEKDGLTDNEFNIASSVKTREGKLFFGGINGISSFYPAQVKKEKQIKPRIYLSRFLTYNNRHNSLVEQSGDLCELRDINLASNDRYCSFTFFINDYYNSLKNTFSYMLEGYDEEWQNPGSQNTITFNGLPPGKYRLLVKGNNSEGLATENQLAYTITVSEVFYRRTWFYVLICCMCVLITYAITKYRANQHLKMQKLRTKISSDLHDEVGGLLTRISVQAELIKQGISPGNSVEEIAETSRRATSAMNDVLWAIDARNDKIGSLIDHMREHAAEILFPLEMEAVFTVTGIEPEKELDSNIRRNLFLIFKEAVNNVAKHSGATTVKILMEKNQNEFMMTIEDNGTQNKKAVAGSGQGLINMKMRAKAIGAELSISNTGGYKIMLYIRNFAWT